MERADPTDRLRRRAGARLDDALAPPPAIARYHPPVWETPFITNSPAQVRRDDVVDELIPSCSVAFALLSLMSYVPAPPIRCGRAERTALGKRRLLPVNTARGELRDGWL